MALNAAYSYRDAEVVYMPHWLKSDGTTVIKNSAGGTFPKPIVEPISIGVIHGFVELATYTDATYKSQLNACNSDTWKSWAPGQAWISRILTEDVEVNGTTGVRVHYIIRCNEFGWNSQIPQFGYYYLDGTDKVPFEEGIGLLDASGQELAPSAPAVNADIQIKRRIAFSSLGF